MTEIEQAKNDFADACINLEIAQGKYAESKQRLVQLLQKPQPEPQQKKKGPVVSEEK